MAPLLASSQKDGFPQLSPGNAGQLSIAGWLRLSPAAAAGAGMSRWRLGRAGSPGWTSPPRCSSLCTRSRGCTTATSTRSTPSSLAAGSSGRRLRAARSSYDDTPSGCCLRSRRPRTPARCTPTCTRPARIQSIAVDVVRGGGLAVERDGGAATEDGSLPDADRGLQLCIQLRRSRDTVVEDAGVGDDVDGGSYCMSGSDRARPRSSRRKIRPLYPDHLEDLVVDEDVGPVCYLRHVACYHRREAWAVGELRGVAVPGALGSHLIPRGRGRVGAEAAGDGHKAVCGVAYDVADIGEREADVDAVERSCRAVELHDRRALDCRDGPRVDDAAGAARRDGGLQRRRVDPLHRRRQPLRFSSESPCVPRAQEPAAALARD
eukprot:161428-Hanusia_phi.AAC.2